MDYQTSDGDENGAFIYRDHPNCDIEVEPNGRIMFLPKEDGSKVLPFQEMVMPSRGFWEGLGLLIHKMNAAIGVYQRDLLVSNMANAELRKENEKQRKVIYVGQNKKEAFFAGLTIGKGQKNENGQK